MRRRLISKPKRPLATVCLLLCTILLGACATKFPTPENSGFTDTSDSLSGNAIFKLSFAAHGGEKLKYLRNINVGITGQWKQLIRRIQPLVTDFKFRVDSQERVLVNKGVYAAEYTGPAGQKSVFRTPSSINVRYNNNASLDSDVLSSTALTADSFYLFLLGPLALEKWQNNVTRLRNQNMNGKPHWRVYINKQPGLGLSRDDEIVLWVDPQSKLTTRVQITLKGHESTKVAHVEVDYLDYKSLGGYVFPSVFFERVKAPIAIDAHAWQLTGLDINRNYTESDIANGYKNDALAPANTRPFK